MPTSIQQAKSQYAWSHTATADFVFDNSNCFSDQAACHRCVYKVKRFSGSIWIITADAVGTLHFHESFSTAFTLYQSIW